MKTDNSLTLYEPPSVELADGRQESPPLAKTRFGIRKKKITRDGVMRPTKLAELILKTKTSYSAEGSRSHVTVIKSDVFVSTKPGISTKTSLVFRAFSLQLDTWPPNGGPGGGLEVAPFMCGLFRVARPGRPPYSEVYTSARRFYDERLIYNICRLSSPSPKNEKASDTLQCRRISHESGWRDLNPRPLRPERSALPNCATPRATV